MLLEEILFSVNFILMVFLEILPITSRKIFKMFINFREKKINIHGMSIKTEKIRFS